MRNRPPRVDDRHTQAWRVIRRLIAAPFALVAFVLCLDGLRFLAWQFTEDYIDTPFWEVGGILFAFGVLFARAAWLLLTSRARPWDWPLVTALATLALWFVRRGGGFFGGEWDQALRLALGSLLVVSTIGTVATVVGFRRGR